MRLITTILALTLTTPLLAQSGKLEAKPPAPKPLPTSIASNPAWPTAAPSDVDTVDHLMAALYGVISGPAGQQRDWNRFRSLFLPDGRMGVIRPDVAATATTPARKGDAALFSPETYIERDDPIFRTMSFYERAVHTNVEEFGNLVSVWSTYESRHDPTDPKPFARGINSLQLIHAQGRYWIASIIWDDERQGLTLPKKYLER